MVPTTPMLAPVIRNTRMIAPWLAPMVRRMPMSRPLSFTSIIRPEMMLNAATSTITDRMMNIMLRSTSSTVKKLSLRCRQSEKCSDGSLTCAHGRHLLGHRLRVGHQHLQHVDRIALVEEALGVRQRHEDHAAVVLRHAHLEDGQHLVGLDARRRAERRRGAARRHQRDGIADVDAQRVGEPRADGDAFLRCRSRPGCRSGCCRPPAAAP